jgi:flavorubredoxin
VFKVDEIGPDVYRLSAYVSRIDLQFNHFLIKDDEPLLCHAGLNRFFPELWEAVARVTEPSGLRWVAFSHFESDECGALNHWLEIAPGARPVCGMLGAQVSVNDFAIREARGLMDGEVLATGKRRYRFCSTPHVPHGWDAGMLFEESSRTLFCSDLCHHMGDVEPLTSQDVVGRSVKAMEAMQAGPLAGYLPYTSRTQSIMDKLAALAPHTLAVMHGSSFTGDGAKALQELAGAYKTIFG